MCTTILIQFRSWKTDIQTRLPQLPW